MGKLIPTLFGGIFSALGGSSKPSGSVAATNTLPGLGKPQPVLGQLGITSSSPSPNFTASGGKGI